MAEHFKEICSNCKAIIGQCRCPDPNKKIKYGICKDCLGNTGVNAQQKPHNNIARIKDLTGRLNGILSEPQPGHFTWHEAIRNLMRELRDALDLVLDPSYKTIEERLKQSRDLCGNG